MQNGKVKYRVAVLCPFLYWIGGRVHNPNAYGMVYGKIRVAAIFFLTASYKLVRRDSTAVEGVS